MRCPRTTWIASVAGLLLWGMNTLAWAQPAGDFPAKLAEALGKLATYDFGGDNGPLNAITEMVTASQKQPEQRQQLAAKLAAVLASTAPRGAKDFACRQLSLIGTADQVPALASLLADDNLSHMGRYALERIPGPAADEALRQALGKVKGKLLVGVINSLGNRRDQNAVSDLAKLVGDADLSVANAAAAALGKVGPAAADVLAPALQSAPAPVRPALGEANLLCAEQLVALGKRDVAAAIYDRLRAAEVPKAIRIAATRGAVLARQAGGVPLLIEQLKGGDASFFGLALTLVREMPGVEATKAVAAELGTLPAERQVALLAALADRRDAAAGPAVFKLAQAGDAKVRPAALQALAKLGDISLVPALLEMAMGGEADVARAATDSLASLPGKDVEAVLLATLEKPDVKLRRVTIEVLGQRRLAAAAPVLLKSARDADGSIRLAAIKALGDTAGAPDLGGLVELLVQAKEPQDRGAAEPALAAVCQRLPDKQAAAEKLAAALAQASPEAKAALLRLLGQVGGGKSLETVLAAVKDASEPVRDTAVDVATKWQDLAAAEVLLNLAKTSETKKYKILAIRGYIRLAGQQSVPADKKLAMSKEALGLAERDDEKRLVLGVLGGVPNAEALALVVTSLENPALKNEASAAAVSIAEKIASSQPAVVAAALKKVLTATENKDLQKKAQDLLNKTEKK
ncbi:MAG: HEAT repeat domain-containing protein [Planctomycetota bacterium]|nr:HEAT repeat domain-containing protein [Planctomycetota bacterium]